MVDSKNFTLKLIELDKLTVDQIQVRIESFGDTTELTSSIKKNGLLQPIRVTPENKEGKHEIIFGKRRYFAFRELVEDDKKFSKIPCYVANKDFDIVEYKILSIAEDFENDLQERNLENNENKKELIRTRNEAKTIKEDYLTLKAKVEKDKIQQSKKDSGAQAEIKILEMQIVNLEDNFNKIYRENEKISDRIDRIISTGEGLKVEFKSSMSIDVVSRGQSERAFFSNIVKPICGMVNSEGGEILIGIKENDKNKGFKSGVQEELRKFHQDSEDQWVRYLNNKLKKYFKVAYLELIKNRSFEPSAEDGIKIFTIKCSPIPLNKLTGSGWAIAPCSVEDPEKKGQKEIHFRNPAETQKLNVEEVAALFINRTLSSD